MAKKVWILLQHRGGQLHRMSREAVAAGQKLAAELGGAASAVLLGSAVGDLANEAAGYDLERVRVMDHAALADYTPGAYVTALLPALASERPDYVVFPHTYQSVDYMARLAQEAGAALVPEVTSFAAVDGAPVWTRPILGGKLQAQVKVKGEGTVFVSVQSGAFQADQAAAGSAPVEPLPGGEPVADRELLGVVEAGDNEVDLTKADVIVGVGRGVGDPDKLGPIEELARKLGADIGASRPVIDSGWLPRDRQIGSSGQTVAPRLYLALGISGAIQHLVGMKGASCVVAVNKDPSAPIFSIARYGIVGDLHEIVPALTKALEDAGL
jgi:electron transfer flavoprotein alpha subunit